MLKKLRNLAPFRVNKQLVESLILSKLDYASTVFYALPMGSAETLTKSPKCMCGICLKEDFHCRVNFTCVETLI